MLATGVTRSRSGHQAGASPGLACYWSSWHDAFRDSAEMKAFLGMEDEDRCLGLFIVAACCIPLSCFATFRLRIKLFLNISCFLVRLSLIHI